MFVLFWTNQTRLLHFVCFPSLFLGIGNAVSRNQFHYPLYKNIKFCCVKKFPRPKIVLICIFHIFTKPSFLLLFNFIILSYTFLYFHILSFPTKALNVLYKYFNAKVMKPVLNRSSFSEHYDFLCLEEAFSRRDLPSKCQS